MNWLPRQGDPTNWCDTCVQMLIKAISFLPIYTALIVTLTLLVVIFGVPFVGGR